MNLMNKLYKHCKGNKKIQILVSINVYILKQAKCNRTKKRTNKKQKNTRRKKSAGNTICNNQMTGSRRWENERSKLIDTRNNQ